MMADAKLILLDEPGAGVNPTLMQKIGDMIIELNQKRGYTFCLIEHDMQLIENFVTGSWISRRPYSPRRKYGRN